MVNSRSSRSLRVKQDSISRVGQSLVRNGFPSQQALAEDLGLTRPTVNNFFTGKQIDRGNFMAICEQLGLDWKEIVEIPPEQQEPRVDWDGAPDVLSFHERIEQRNQLKQWIVEDKCRVIAVLGIGGIGKTSLVKVVAEDIINDFDYVIWRCLTHTPPVEHILLSLIKFISKENFESFDTADQRINQLIDCLKKKRCLIILDNAESIFQQGGNCGAYNDGCKDYETLLQRLSTERHKSCLVLTSRELPANLKPLVGDGLSVRKLQLKSIGRDATQKILRDKGLTPSQKEANQLEEKYSGNPAIINIVASCICDLYSGDIQGFIRSDLFVFNGVQEFLEIGRAHV